MSPLTQTFMAALQRDEHTPLAGAAEAFYAQMKALSDSDALAHTRALIAQVLPIKDQLEGNDIDWIPSRLLTDQAFRTLINVFAQEAPMRGHSDGTGLSKDEIGAQWSELVDILSASELLPQRVVSRAPGKTIRFRPTEAEVKALDTLTAQPVNEDRVHEFLYALDVQTQDQLLRAARLIRDHRPKGDSPWFEAPRRVPTSEIRPTPITSWVSDWDNLIQTALAGRLDSEAIYRVKALVAGEHPLPPTEGDAVPTTEEDAALRAAGRAAKPTQALQELLQEVNDSDTAFRLARGIRDRWYVYGAFPQVAGNKCVHTVEDALLRAWNLLRPQATEEARAQLRDILVTELMEPAMKHSVSPEQPSESGGETRRKPTRRP